MRPLGIVAPLLLTVALSAAPATASERGSLLLTVPGSGQAVVLQHTEPDYGRLAALVTVEGGDGSSLDVQVRGPGVTLAWLGRDDDVRRVDRVYLGGDDGVWVATQRDAGDGYIWDDPLSWHRPAAPGELADVLDRRAQAAAANSAPSFPLPGADVWGVVDGPTLPEPRTAPAATADPASGTPGWWGPLGVVGTLLLAVTWLRRLRDPGGPDDDAAPPRPGAEQLSWP